MNPFNFYYSRSLRFGFRDGSLERKPKINNETKTNSATNSGSNINKLSKTTKLLSIICILGFSALILCSCLLYYFCYFQKTSFMNEDVPITDFILKKEKKEKRNESQYIVASYKTI